MDHNKSLACFRQCEQDEKPTHEKTNTTNMSVVVCLRVHHFKCFTCVGLRQLNAFLPIFIAAHFWPFLLRACTLKPNTENDKRSFYFFLFLKCFFFGCLLIV